MEQLTPQDYQNLKVCCLRVAKLPDVDENAMKALMILSEKIDRIAGQQGKAVAETKKEVEPIEEDLPPVEEVK